MLAAASEAAAARLMERSLKNDFHPCTFAPLSVWARLILENRGVARPYWGRAARILALSALAAPLRVAESLIHSRRVNGVVLDPPPLFILGFARSGTTHLQNLITQDARFGYFTTWQGATSAFSLIGRGRLKRLMEKGMAASGEGERTRPMDNVKITLDTPQEEDLALANVSPMSFVHQLSFPRRTLPLFDRYVMMGAGADGEASGELSPRELRRWERDYLGVLRKAALLAGGKHMVFRNTVNTARADHLLRLFPRARFINIVRNPYTVYPSLLHLYRTLLPLYQLDRHDREEMERLLVEMYRRVMTKYLRDRERIPAGQLAEVRYEDLERDPLGELARLYRELDLPGWSDAEPRVAAYLRTLSGYRKNRLPMDRGNIDRVSEHWGFAVDAWDYEPPGAGE